MRHTSASAIVVAVGLIAANSGEMASADNIHATASVQLHHGSDTQQGSTYAMATATDNQLRYFDSATATASGNHGVSVSASSFSGTAAGSVGSGPIYAAATWSDRVVLGLPIGAATPAYLDFYFSTSGTVSGTGDGGGGIIGTTAGGTNAGSTSFTSQYVYSTDGGTDYVQGGPWDTIVAGGGHFAGTYHTRVGLLTSGQGEMYGDWSVTYQVTANVGGGLLRGGTLSINGNDPPTFSFNAVRLPDGRTPEEAGLTLRFASGIASPNAVPEPSSAVMLTAGVLGILCYRWKRRVTTRVGSF